METEEVSLTVAKRHNNQLLYLAILALGLLLIPFVISAMQKQAFEQAAASSGNRMFDSQ